MTHNFKRRLTVFFGAVVVVVAFCAFYARTHPLVFNESFFEHAHCIVLAGQSLRIYAQDHEGRFPYHTNGYGDALLLVTDAWFPSLTGPGYDVGVFERALKTGQHVPESECGRVYVQGLSETNDHEIALLFDKLPTPGGDHCNGLARIRAPLAREVLTIDTDRRVIRESEWQAYAKRQIALLVAAGILREQAEKYYSERPQR
jgi:hypothetical protein